MKNNNIHLLEGLFESERQRHYGRFVKKIYENRIAKSEDKLYAINEYLKNYDFKTKAPLLIHGRWKRFINFMEQHRAIGASVSASIKLFRTQVPPTIDSSSFEEASPEEITMFQTERDTEFIEIEANENNDTTADTEIPEYNPHILTDEALVKRYAEWKAQNKFLKFLQDEKKKYLSKRETENQDAIGGDGSNSDTDNKVEEKDKKHFTTRRQTLAMHYLNLCYKITQGNIKSYSKFVRFLTGKNEKDVYDFLRRPMEVNPDQKREGSDKALIADLNYIEQYFIDMDCSEVVKLIQKDIKSIKAG